MWKCKKCENINSDKNNVCFICEYRFMKITNPAISGKKENENFYSPLHEADKYNYSLNVNELTELNYTPVHKRIADVSELHSEESKPIMKASYEEELHPIINNKKKFPKFIIPILLVLVVISVILFFIILG